MGSPVTITQALDDIVGGGTPVVSVAPVNLAAPGRAVPLEVRVSAPAVQVSSVGESALRRYAPRTCSNVSTDR
ncbi:hypothetical protein [Micromonospora sp. NPDC049799]|uniref:hypothetical protein n=1 Tax=Micromonospora sp. NPDC049799 TaxID=3154741 RepID=UPI0033CB0BD9